MSKKRTGTFGTLKFKKKNYLRKNTIVHIFKKINELKNNHNTEESLYVLSDE